MIAIVASHCVRAWAIALSISIFPFLPRPAVASSGDFAHGLSEFITVVQATAQIFLPFFSAMTFGSHGSFPPPSARRPLLSAASSVASSPLFPRSHAWLLAIVTALMPAFGSSAAHPVGAAYTSRFAFGSRSPVAAS